ncbi:hypothetical protein [Oceanisphaera ostreae]|uniref:Uncharacterized protein n=1 Tax=Oceanisphaera ostreae TaxID=914151 RepID=A0ABW3KCW2_9GAMM
MAYIGKMFIAGSESHNGIYKCGISYSLSAPPPCSYVYDLKDGGWQVEFTEGAKDVVARTKQSIPYDLLHIEGFSAVQEALDVMSVKGISSISLGDPASSNVGVYERNGKYILFSYALIDFPMGIEMEVIQTDSLGNVIEQQKPLEPVWNESFRYYRLSQSSTDYFEAYRNLFLALEALLNSLFPKNKSEGEGAWLKRSLSEVNKKVSLRYFTPTGKEDPVEYIIKTQYKDVRCQLQHAKFPNSQLPHSSLTPIKVKNAYSNLVAIWMQIAGDYYNVPMEGGIITNTGFYSVLDGVFNKGVDVYFSPDNTKPSGGDVEVSPILDKVFKLDSSKYIGQVSPGIVRVIASEELKASDSSYERYIHRICSGYSGEINSVCYIESGLMISGVDIWESIQDFRLVNTCKPKVEFKT